MYRDQHQGRVLPPEGAQGIYAPEATDREHTFRARKQLIFVTPAEKRQNFFGVFLQFHIGVDTATLSNQMTNGFYGIQGQLAECCCNTNRNIDQLRYDGAMNTAAINANTTAVGQKILDKMCENEANALRSRVQQLELQASLCGIPRTNPYGYGIYAYNACGGCGCNGWGNGNI